MTERPHIRRPRPWPVIAGALAVFFAIVVLLAFQTRAERLGAGPSPRLAVAAVLPPPRRVVLRRVIVTRVITELRDDDALAGAPITIAAPPLSPAPARAPVPAAPVAAAPAAPAAPAPAPLTTHTS